MNMTRIFWLGFAASQLLIGQDAFAHRAGSGQASMHASGDAWQSANPVSKPNTTAHQARVRRNRHADSTSDNRRGPGDGYRSGYTAGLRAGKHSTAQAKRSRRDFLAAEKYATHEQAERDVRAGRIYHSSQVSAPIIVDAKACRRIGSHGESIYENCQLVAGTCNARTDVAPCRPSD